MRASRRGTLTAIVGPNGAGKTTYFNLISGQLRASAGQVLLDGADITALPRVRAHAPRSRPRLPAHQSVPATCRVENVRLAVQAAPMRAGRCFEHGTAASRPDRAGRSGAATASRLADKRDVRAGGPARMATSASSRSRSCMALEPQVFMFDEPTAGMSVDEVPVILDLIHELKARRRRRPSCWSSTRWTWCAARRPHRRAAQRHAGGRRRAGRGDRLADRAGGYLGVDGSHA